MSIPLSYHRGAALHCKNIHATIEPARGFGRIFVALQLRSD
ncbi:MAG: hypothetical protein P1U53_09780 [Sulfitobacter sp.]|nr:hypothetical protein [Sulfitobacter sp.]